MESETSGIVRLGIVLIALAVLIGLGFGIFQISKSVANDGISDVQAELNDVSKQKFSSYDQKVINGTMTVTALSDFEGESVAILIANQSWKDIISNSEAKIGELQKIYDNSSGISSTYGSPEPNDELEYTGIQLPIIWAYADKELKEPYKMYTSDGKSISGVFINYNAIIGGAPNDKTLGIPLGTTEQEVYVNGNLINTAGIYFDNDCWICTSGFATDNTGRMMFNKIVGNLSKSGRTEFIPVGAKFQSYLLKDESGTIMGIVLEQVSQNS